MKKIKRLKQIVYVVLTALFFSNYVSAQVTVSNGGTYYICQGSSLEFEVYPIANDYVDGSGTGSAWWQWGSPSNTCTSPSCTFSGYTVTNITTDLIHQPGYGYVVGTVTCNTNNSIVVTVDVYKISSNTHDYYITFTIVPYSTTISGATDFCHTSNETYTCVTNVPGVGANSYTWGTLPAFLSGTAPTTSTYSTTTTGSGTGTVTVVVSGTCGSGSNSNNGGLSVTSEAGAPATPSGGLTMRQTGSSCEFDATIPAVTGATSYVWSESASMSPTICSHGYTTYPCGDFDYSTTYSIYVKASNACGTSAYGYWSHMTPGKPAGCQETPIGPEGQATIQSEFKLYPNPSASVLNIEYPTPTDVSSEIVCAMYDMVGHEVISWTLPASQNKVTENTSCMQDGVYLYVITTGGNILSRGKLVIQK